jgi:hypothetical protein
MTALRPGEAGEVRSRRVSHFACAAHVIVLRLGVDCLPPSCAGVDVNVLTLTI